MQDNTPFYYKGYKSQATPQAPAFWTNKICSSPKSIFSHLDKYAYGHCAYKKKLAYFIYQAVRKEADVQGVLKLIFDVTSFIILCELIASAFRLRKVRKEITARESGGEL